MRTRLYIGATVIALAATVSGAAAMTSEKGALRLTGAQEHEIYQDVSKLKMSQPAPAKFTAKVGEAVPSSIKLHPLPASATKKVSAAKPYDYAMLRKEVLLVDPGTKKIATIITR